MGMWHKMKKIFHKKVILYSGWDLQEANRIMDCLKDHQIYFKFTMKDQVNRSVGRGTTRSNFGSAGVRQDYQILYTIRIYREDEYQAREIIKVINRKKE